MGASIRSGTSHHIATKMKISAKILILIALAAIATANPVDRVADEITTELDFPINNEVVQDRFLMDWLKSTWNSFLDLFKSDAKADDEKSSDSEKPTNEDKEEEEESEKDSEDDKEE